MLVSPGALQFKQGDIVLIWGATGGLGSYAVQFVRNGGGIAVGVVGSERKARLLDELGCDVVLRRDLLELDGLSDSRKGKLIGAEIRRAVGEDPHIVFDHVGRETFGVSVYVLRRGGSGRHLRIEHGLQARVRQPLPVDESLSASSAATAPTGRSCGRPTG